MHPTEHKKFTRFTPFVVMGLVALVGGVFVSVLSVQQNQDNRSRATYSVSNYVKNPTCDSSSSYWGYWQSTVRHASGVARSGSGSCYVTRSTGTAYSMDDNPNSVSYPKQGEVYTATAWVKSTTAIGKPIYMSMRVNGGYASSVKKYGPAVYLSSNWQQITGTFTVDRSDRTSLDIYIVQEGAAYGHSFYVDDITLYKGQSGSYYPTPTTAYYPPTPTPTVYYAPTPTPTPYYAPTATPTPTVYYQPTPTPTAYITPVPPTPYVTITPTPYVTPTGYPTSTPMPTTTPVPGSTQLALTLALHGIGKGGDSANPTSTGNTTPLHPQRPVIVDIYDNSNTLVKTQQGTVSYDAESGLFKGIIGLEGAVYNGFYTIKVKTNQFLRALVPGIHNLATGQTFEMQKTTLINGDINNDNMVNILDYNLLIGCYSDLAPATNCASGDEVRSDITDDGHVNQFDYNLFLRELTNQGGQ